ncbi:tRNA (adenosine(37)-N6)-threonylcarbamoyltransferase complex ATPase subunit type 1 TsaE [Sneathiella sp.]|uniref:tRNA (adenosine(37)-N6)-threonylcarbamoyltransferase complex ATPase subunit type 1 TsaE n=1 Tax=Sneathiella sp. TaxID=1964365 RepID=UPI0035667EFF
MTQPPLIFQQTCATLEDTSRLAATFAGTLAAGDVVALKGTLGAGKTAFARGVIGALLGLDTDVPSPTYNLLLTYETDGFALYHYDLYRLAEPEDAFELDIEDAFAGEVSLIEWPERLGRYLPPDHLRIEIEPLTPEGEGRRFKFFGNERWQQRLAALAENANA